MKRASPFGSRSAHHRFVRRGWVCFAAGLVLATAHAQIVPASGLIGYWAGNGNANDSSSFANNGVFSGSYATGISGQAFQISSSVYVTIADFAQYTISGDFSVGFWFKGSVGGSFLGQDDGAGGQAKWFVDYGYINAGVFNLHLNGGSGLTVLPSSAVAPTSSEWHSFALVKSGTTYTFYLDGTTIGSQTSTYSPFPDPSSSLIFGFTETAVPNYTGLMDEVVLYNRALTGAEVQQLAAIPEPSITSALAALAAVGASLLKFRSPRGRIIAPSPSGCALSRPRP